MKNLQTLFVPRRSLHPTCLPIADALSLPLYVEFGLSEWYSPVTLGTGLHPRPTPADDLQRYFPRPSHGSSTDTDTDVNRDANANGSYIDPRWTPTYLVTRKGESVAEVYARCEEFLRAFIGRVEGRRPSLSPSTSALAAVPSVDDGEDGEYREHGAGVGVGHERVLLVSHAATTIVLTRALTGNAGGMRVGCCTLTTLERAASAAALPAPPTLTPAAALVSSTARDVIGRGEWTVRGALADGAFLAGGAERCWGMGDVETHAGVVVENAGVPHLRPAQQRQFPPPDAPARHPPPVFQMVSH